MRLPRMTTRRWMIVIAVAGVMMAGIVHVRLKLRQRDFLALTTAHAQKVVAIADRKGDLSRQQRESDRLAHSIDYHTSLVHKYEHAALHPWLPVEPDPPEPE
jgi:hypothetical protein